MEFNEIIFTRQNWLEVNAKDLRGQLATVNHGFSLCEACADKKRADMELDMLLDVHGTLRATALGEEPMNNAAAGVAVAEGGRSGRHG